MSGSGWRSRSWSASCCSSRSSRSSGCSPCRPACSSATTRTSAPTGAPGRGAGSWPTACSPALVTGLTAAVLLLAIKALFFFADNGYPRPGRSAARSRCRVGADCVYQRYLDDGRGPELEAAGVTDAGVLHAVLLERAVRERRHDPGPDDARRARWGGALWRVPAEAGGPGCRWASPGARGRGWHGACAGLTGALSGSGGPRPEGSKRPGDRGASSLARTRPRAYSLMAAFLAFGAALAVAFGAALAWPSSARPSSVRPSWRFALVGWPSPAWPRAPRTSPRPRRRPWPRRPRLGRSCSARRGPCRRPSGRPWPCRPCRPRCGPWRPSPRRPCRSS